MSFIRPILSGLGAVASFAKGVLPVKVLKVQKPTLDKPCATATIQFGRNRLVGVEVRLSRVNPLWANAFWDGNPIVFGEGDSAFFSDSRISHESPVD